MPTAARLIAALVLAALSWFVSEQIKPLFLEGKDFGWFTHINVAMAFVIGWKVIGSRCGRGYSAAIGNGLTGGAVLVFWGLLIQGAYKMFEKSIQLRYDGAFEAFADIFDIMAEYGLTIATPYIALSLFVGSIGAGLLSEMTEQYFT